ncbi:protein of unknown function [Halogranum rubrum]|uniref:DUF4177 domain-containing protein n=2 Tax=Halogranum rubrum TaxID=553466 RepID=A0A1I4FGT2_9EURY|nr:MULTISPECIES: DUF4177 domain-containing protein [Halogranum]EJN61303.1 hypothetical protein HSB1_03440 [Halogranum salarium B-1]SFL16653.1 protein of unknown function [Halogranum rubrum]
MSEWEYKVLHIQGGNGTVSEDLLNRYGDDGWELATSLTGAKTGLGGRPKSTTDALVFKRPKE